MRKTQILGYSNRSKANFSLNAAVYSRVILGGSLSEVGLNLLAHHASAAPTFKNWQSKLVLSKIWQRQHNVSVDPPLPLLLFVKLLEKTLYPSKIDRSAPIKAPIFVLGTPRCGSTLLSNLIQEHEETFSFTNATEAIGRPGLYFPFVRLIRALSLDVSGQRYLMDSIILDIESPSEATRFWAESLKLDLKSLTWPNLKLEDFSESEIVAIFDAIRYASLCSQSAIASRFVSKSPGLLTQVHLLSALFPDAKFIHLVRDGRMVANSLMKLFALQQRQDKIARHPDFRTIPFTPYPRVPGLSKWIEMYGAEDLRTTANIWASSIDYIASVKGSTRNFIEVRYEDLCADPRGKVTELREFCGLSRPQKFNTKLEAAISKVGTVQHQNHYDGFEIVEAIATSS